MLVVQVIAKEVAQRYDTFTTNQIWEDEFGGRRIPDPPIRFEDGKWRKNRKCMAAVLNRARRAGIIEWTGLYMVAERTVHSNHVQTLKVWRRPQRRAVTEIPGRP